MNTPKTLILYRFKVRDPITGKWFTTSYHLTIEEAQLHYGDGNYELLQWSREVRDVGDPLRLSAAHVQRGGGMLFAVRLSDDFS